MSSLRQRDNAVTNRTENAIDEDEIDAAVAQSLEAIALHIESNAGNDEFRRRLEDAVEESLRHSAEITGLALRKNWIAEDEQKRYAVVEANEEIAENTAQVLGDAGFRDPGILAAFVHRVYEDVAGLDLAADEYVLVVPVAEPLRDVYW